MRTRHLLDNLRFGGSLLAAALVLTACASGPRPVRLSEQAVADGLHRVEVRSPGALLVTPSYSEQRARADRSGGFALASCMVAFQGEHDQSALKPLQDSLNGEFCSKIVEQLKDQSGIEVSKARPGMIVLEAYLLNLDPNRLTGDASDPRFTETITGRLYIKGTQDGKPVLRYSENTELARGSASSVIDRAVTVGVGNMSRIYSRLEASSPDVAAQP